MKRFSFLAVLLLLGLSFFLVGCIEDQKTTKEDIGKSPETSEGRQGGVVTYAFDGFIGGVFDPAWSNKTNSSAISLTQGFMTEGIFSVDANLEYVPNIATWDISEDRLTYTFTFNKGVKWHNGEELTVEDYAFALETIAHPDYDGHHFNRVEHVKGAKAKQDGMVDTIEGIEIVDPYTIKITFEEVNITNLEKLWAYPMPKKHYEGIPVAELAMSEHTVLNPIGFGPFKVKNIKIGEFIEYERFDQYWQGKPLLDGIVLKVIEPSVVVGAFQNGEVDIMGLRPEMIQGLQTVKNVRIESSTADLYSFIGLRFGHSDQETGKNIANFDKFKSKELRQALYYAINRPGIIEAFLKGYAVPINSPIPQAFWIAAEQSELNQYEYNPEKAKDLLTTAGYLDIDRDGFVEDPDGKPFSIAFGHYAGPSDFEGRAQAIVKSWNDIGVKTTLATNSLIEFRNYFEMLDNDDSTIEAFFTGWATGVNADPSIYWSNHSPWNRGRWVDEENQRLLDEAISEKAFDRDYRKQVYVEWQKHFNEQVPAIPLWENKIYYGINSRLQGVSVNVNGSQDNLHKWYITD